MLHHLRFMTMFVFRKLEEKMTTRRVVEKNWASRNLYLEKGDLLLLLGGSCSKAKRA